MTSLFDHDDHDHDHGPPLDPVTRNAVLDAGQRELRARLQGRREALSLTHAANTGIADTVAQLRDDLKAAAALVQAARAERDAARLECERLRGAMSDAGYLDVIAAFLSGDATPGDEEAEVFAGDCRRWAAAIRALPAVTAPDAGAVWTRGDPDEEGPYWLLMRGMDGPSHYGEWNGHGWSMYGSELPDGEVLAWAPVTPPPGWREALAALDTPQEA